MDWILLDDYSKFFISGSVSCDRSLHVEVCTKRQLILRKG